MQCYECSPAGVTREAIGICYHCSAALYSDRALAVADPVTTQYLVARTVTSRKKHGCFSVKHAGRRLGHRVT